MSMTKVFELLKLALVVLLLGSATACQGPTEDEGALGTLSMRLTGASPSGNQYRLVGATFDIVGPESSTVTGDPDEESIELDVPAGSYTVTLEDGWSVERLQSGTWTAVDAVLTSNPTVALTVVEGAVSEATYRFGIGDDFISFGKGRISIGAEFDDEELPPPVLTTLAAADRGWWNANGLHTSTNQNTLTGFITQGFDVAFNSYFTFDRSSVPGEIVGATLRLELELYAGAVSPHTLSVWDVSTSAAGLDADDLGSTTGQAVFDDLQSGTTYGTFVASSGDVTTVIDIPLGAAAVNDLNAATSTFSVGIHVDDLVIGVDDFVRFSFGDEARVHELVLAVQP